jgi:hypothetical protein
MKTQGSGGSSSQVRHGIALSALRPGDVLMTACGTAQSRTIRLACKSNFSHAALHEANGRFFEAIGTGVTIFNIARFGIRDLANVRILRALGPGGPSAAAQAATHAGRYVQRGYWYGGAVGSIFGNKKTSERESFFCSYLVAQAYVEAGYPLVDGPPYDCHPGVLERSGQLTDVTSTCLASVSEHVARGLAVLDDGDHQPTAVHEYHRRFTDILRRIEPAFRRHGLGYPVTVEAAVARLFDVQDGRVRAEVDGIIDAAMEDAGFAELYSLVTAGLNLESPTYPEGVTKEEFRATIRNYKGLLQNAINDIRDETREVDAAGKLHQMTGLKSQLQIKRHYECRVRGIVRHKHALEAEIARLEKLVVE